MNDREVGLHGLSFPVPFLPRPQKKREKKGSLDVKHDGKGWRRVVVRARELCEQAGGPALSFSTPFFPRPLRFLWT